MSRKFTVTCPHCGTLLTIDAGERLVIDHQPPKAASGARLDLDSRLKALDQEKQRAEARMEEALRAEQAKQKLLEERFRKLMESAPDDEEPPPVRDIDLD